jgi:hypothetical protein
LAIDRSASRILLGKSRRVKQLALENALNLSFFAGAQLSQTLSNAQRRVIFRIRHQHGFLGFEFRRIRSRQGRWMPLRIPKAKKRTALLATLRVVFRRSQSRPVRRLIEEINPILRGWVNYFAMGHSSWCFAFIRDWVEKKIRSHLARACQRRGFGWKRWSREWLYETLGLFNKYHVSYRPSPTAVPIT